MSMGCLSILYLGFKKEDKEEVLEIIKLKGWRFSILIQDDNSMRLEFEWDIEEEDIEELKSCCSQIVVSFYDYSNEGSFQWEDEDDELTKIMRLKNNQKWKEQKKKEQKK